MHTQKKFSVCALTEKGMRSAVLWALFLSIIVVTIAALLGRAARNMRAALTDQEQSDIAIYILLENEHLGKTTLLRSNADNTERDYLAEARSGPMLVILKWGGTEWYVARTERLHK